jgi:SAM-dependent methyltransferase
MRSGTAYARNLWLGSSETTFYSGARSSLEFGIPYAAWVNAFIAENNIRSVVDLGCGDFRVGQLIRTGHRVRYVGIDVVPALVEYNQSRFSTTNVTFECLDIIEDPLPDADLCLIRQVPQHLSNAEIAEVLSKCGKYPFVCVADEIPVRGGVRPNLDKPHGPDSRGEDNFGVFVEFPRFNLPAQTVLELSTAMGTTLRTMLVDNRERRASVSSRLGRLNTVELESPDR